LIQNKLDQLHDKPAALNPKKIALAGDEQEDNVISSTTRHSQAARKRLTVLRDGTTHLRIILRHTKIAEIETRPDIATQQGVSNAIQTAPTIYCEAAPINSAFDYLTATNGGSI
jgi:hypothetical protein